MIEIDKRITGRTKLIGLIGNPVEHTISPQLHNTISKYLHKETTYVPLKVENDDLKDAVKGLKALNFAGFNVTVPYKKEVMKYIDENSKEALLMGAVNTVKSIRGKLYGYNTDGEGFSRAFKEATGTTFKNKKIAILGAGGSARAIAVKLSLEGAQSIAVINRTVSRAEELCELVNNNIRHVAKHYGWEDDTVDNVFADSDIIINTTSLGMYPDVDKYPYRKPIKFKNGQIVYDIIYNPAKTRFLEEAEKQGCMAINGLGMLFYQGIYAYEIWSGIKLKEDFLRELFLEFSGLLGVR